MNVNFNPNYQSPNFGMAIKIDPNAKAILKKQTAGLSSSSFQNFWKSFDEAVERQADNPVDIIIRKCNHRNALAAEVVDNGSEPLENTVYSQGFIFPSKMKFINKAEKRAETLNDLNQRLSKYTEAVEDDYLTAIEKESAGGMDIEA